MESVGNRNADEARVEIALSDCPRNSNERLSEQVRESPCWVHACFNSRVLVCTVSALDEYILAVPTKIEVVRTFGRIVGKQEAEPSTGAIGGKQYPSVTKIRPVCQKLKC